MRIGLGLGPGVRELGNFSVVPGLTGLVDYWQPKAADQTLVGSKVSDWTGHLNAKHLLQGTDANRPDQTTTDVYTCPEYNPYTSNEYLDLTQSLGKTVCYWERFSKANFLQTQGQGFALSTAAGVAQVYMFREPTDAKYYVQIAGTNYSTAAQVSDAARHTVFFAASETRVQIWLDGVELLDQAIVKTISTIDRFRVGWVVDSNGYRGSRCHIASVLATAMPTDQQIVAVGEELAALPTAA